MELVQGNPWVMKIINKNEGNKMLLNNYWMRLSMMS